MLTEVKKHVKLLGYYFKLNLAAAMEYRVSFIFQTCGMMLNNLSFAFFWYILFYRVGSIAGYGYTDVMTLWAISSASYGIAFILFGNLKYITEIIIKGELDIYLAQPKSVLLNLISSKTIVYAWGDLFYGIGLYLFICSYKGDFSTLPLYFIFIITGACFFISVLIAASSLTFYIGDSSGIRGLVFEFLITLTLYPMGIYQGFVKLCIFTIIPAGFLSVLPMEILKQFNLGGFLIILGATIVWLIGSVSLFYKGLKRYESGNLIISRL